MIPTRWLHCRACDVAYRGQHGIDVCWYCGTHDAVELANGIPDSIRRGSDGRHLSWSDGEAA